MEFSIEKAERKLLPQNFKVDKYEDLAPYLNSLLQREIQSVEELKIWIRDYSELEAFIEEDMAWRYINYTRYTDNEEYVKAYQNFVENIQPELARIQHELDKKFVGSDYFEELKDPDLQNLKKKSKLSIELYEEKNIPLQTEQSKLGQEYNAVQGGMSIEYNGQEFTMQQAAAMLREPDRAVRKEIFEKLNERRLEDGEKLDQLFDKLASLRHEQAQNLGFDNYRDYKHKALARFDYGTDKVLEFHESIKEVIVPRFNDSRKRRKKALGYDCLRPYDLAVNIYSSEPLRPYKREEADELIRRSINSFERIHPFFGNTLKEMKSRGFLDLESRKGKAPGGYNYPLDETGLPFIFMNGSGTMSDVTTLAHEGGHAVHAVLCNQLKLAPLKHCPSEIAELASMSMELFAMDTWDEFFKDEASFLRAKIEQLEGILDILPWVATVDKFQHWIYTHPTHTSEERDAAFMAISDEFSSDVVDYKGYEHFRAKAWQKQLHIYEVPFYYIEYGIAQLGALAMFRNFKENPDQTLDSYMKALSLGYTRSIPEIYEAAGIRFEFSKDYIEGLFQFLEAELGELISRYQKLNA